jgi:hypothetical protein
MRQGHSKKARKPKIGKAALWAQIQGQGQEVSKGRSVFKRSVNNGSQNRWYYCHDRFRKSQQRRALKHEITTEAFECEEDCYHHDERYWDVEEGEAEWEPHDAWWWLPDPQASPTVVQTNPHGELCRRLYGVGARFDAKHLNPDALGRPLQSFESLQKDFLRNNGHRFCKELGRHMGSMEVRPAPVSESVQARFLDARASLGGLLKAAYRGTNVTTLSKIYDNGLLIPGQGNGVHVVNGSAHGLGIYTAKLDNPSLSWSFCRASHPSERKMIICGVLDDAIGRSSFTQYNIGLRSVTSESENVRHVGSAMVVFDHRRVVPLFEVAQRKSMNEKPPASVFFDWNRHQYLVQRMANEAVPPKHHRRRAPRRKGCCGSQMPSTPQDFAHRRAARKRRCKGL